MNDATLNELLQKIHDKQAVVGIIGLGYVGLPLAREFVAKGFSVLGFDIDAKKVETLNAGESYLLSVPPAMIAQWRHEKRFEATADVARLGEPDALLICVPTPLNANREPEMRYIRQTAESIATVLRPQQLIVLESTTYPGTTAELVVPILESHSGLKAGVDFLVAFSPEREDPGNKNFSTGTIPKVVGADDGQSLAVADALYAAILPKTVPVSSTRAAEATKLLENIFRAVNIALVNELKMCFDRMGIDVWEVIEAAKTKPFGYMPFYPGPGLGGHCIPIDPFYLTWKARQFDFNTRFIELAGEINTGMPRYVLSRVMDALNDDGKALKEAQILLLGAAYKPDIDDLRESPALELTELLEHRGAHVRYFDPYCSVMSGFRHYPALHKTSEPALTADLLAQADCVIITTNHTTVDYQFVLDHARIVVDTRNACAGKTGRARILKA